MSEAIIEKIFVGPMGGRKTEGIILKHRSALSRSLAILPDIDTRSDKALRTHKNNHGVSDVESRNIVVVPANEPSQILVALEQALRVRQVEQLLVDETNFFSPALVEVLSQIAAMDIDVFAAGLLLDSDLGDFGATRSLAQVAAEVVPVFAECDFRDKDDHSCDQLAVYNYFRGKKPGQVFVGGFGVFGASCPSHYNPFREQYELEPLPPELVHSDIWKV